MAEATAGLQDEVSVTEKFSKESYLPKGYNDYLLQGTALENSEDIKTGGLYGGSLSTDLTKCFGFTDENNTLLIIPFDSSLFESANSASTQYEIKKNLDTPVKYYRRVNDRDGRRFSRKEEAYSNKHIPKEKLASFCLTDEQRKYVSLIDKLFIGDVVGSVDIDKANKFAEAIRASGHDAKTPKELENLNLNVDWGRRYWNGNPEGALHEEMKYKKYLEQKQLSEILDIPLSDMTDLPTLISSLNKLGGEEKIFEKIVSKFPGSVKMNWNNSGMDEKSIPKILIEQVYKTMLTNMISDEFDGVESPHDRRVILEGPSKKGLDTLLSS